MTEENRCYARDANGSRCTVTGEHREITNATGQRAHAHETKTSIWSTPVSSIVVVSGPATPAVDREIAQQVRRDAERRRRYR